MSALYRQKLLIADRSEDYCCLLAGILKGKYEIRCCCTGPETVELLESFQPDVLILDVCMPMLDGIRILRTEGMFRPAAIIALISSNGDALMKQLTFLGVDHIMLKPCNIPSLLNRLEEFRQMQQLRIPSHAASYGRVSKMLTQLSFPPGRNTEYIRTALPYLVCDPMQGITKELYPVVAEIQGCGSWYQVERGIRSAIRNAYQRRDPQVWQRYFGEEEGCPSNKAFLLRIAQALIREADEEMAVWRAEQNKTSMNRGYCVLQIQG